MRPFLIGIAGASGSGKSELARRLAAALGEPCSLVSLDSYYRVLDHMPVEARARVNFDHPDALDWDLFLAHLGTLASGRPISEPVYLFDLHTRAPGTRTVEPAPYIIVEGILVLHHPAVRATLSLGVYVETPDEECFRRRLERDVRERGRSAESVVRQYEETVRPMAALYVWPSKAWAGLVVSGVQPLARSVAEVLNALGRRPACPSQPPPRT